MQVKNNSALTHTGNIDDKRQLNASFERKKLTKEEIRRKKIKIEQEKQRKKIEDLIEKKLVEAEKKEEKQKELTLNHKHINSNEKDISTIPAVPLKDFNVQRETKEKKESAIARFFRKIRENRKLNEEKRKQIEEEKLLRKQEKEAEKIRIKNEQKLLESNVNNNIDKEEKKKRIQEEKQRVEQEKIEKKRKAEEEKLLRKQEKEAEKNRIKLEKETLSKTISVDNALSKKERKEKLAKEKELLKQKKDEERKQRLKEKYEEEVKRKKEKEDRQIIQINERKEKERKIKKEREQARKERKEKALLIKKAQEESRQKARKERKSLNEKVNEWYNNLSFVKDRRNRRELQRQTLLIDFDGADAVRSEEKIMYKYVAKSAETGKVETGYFAAFSKLDVHSFLMAEGYEVYEITPQKNFAKTLTLFSPKFKATELDFFLTQLSTFLKAGMTLVESVKILSKQSKKSAHKNVYKSIIYELTMGENFSEALAKQGNIFPRLLINMIKTSELTGDLPETLDDMASYYRETDKTRKQMISAMSYPIVLLIFAFAILIFIMVKVIPQFVSIYSNLDTGVPPITRAILNISNFMQGNWINLILGIIGFIIVFIILYKNIKVFKSVVQTIIMNIPVIGKIIIYNEVTMFTKTFASLLNHNVYITDSMEVLSKITNNEIYKMLIFDTITNLAKGEAISNSFKNHWAFPSIAYEMILTGEKTGQLGSMMDKVANYYDEQHRNAVNQIKAFIEPVMIIILAAMVGVILLSIVIPMFDMYQNISSM